VISSGEAGAQLAPSGPVSQELSHDDPLALPARLSIQNVPLDRALIALEATSGTRFVYSPSRLPLRLVTCACEHLSVGEALERMLAIPGVRYLVRGSHIVVEASTYPRPGSSPTTATASPQAAAADEENPSARGERSPLPRRERTGEIRGVVLSAQSGEPLSTVQVQIDGTARGTITDDDGFFVLSSVPEGTYTVLLQHIGNQPVRRSNVRVTAESAAHLDVAMDRSVLVMQEIVATGMIDPIESVRSPITVARVTRDMVRVMPPNSPLEALQGVVAGVHMVRMTGQPGTESPITLRSPTSVRLSNSPLIVVDGVILGSGTVDIESLDIESLEVVKGASAASLYGSRAAAGVVSIRTKRGLDLPLGTTRFAARTEFGTSHVGPFETPRVHFYAINPATGHYVNVYGRDTTRAGRFEPSVAFMENPFPPGTELFDNVAAVYRPGAFTSQSVSIAQNSEATNFAASLARHHEEGAVAVNDGYRRTSLRVNVDHRFAGTLKLGLSTYHSRAELDEFGNAQGLLGSPFWAFLAAPVDIDITRRDEKGKYVMQPDPEVFYESPLWRQESQIFTTRRDRTLANADLRWTPLNWWSAFANISYDREDARTRHWVPKDTPFSLSTAHLPSGRWGRLEHQNGLQDAFNGSIQSTFRSDIGRLNVRGTGRSVYEFQEILRERAVAENFTVPGVPSMDAASPDHRQTSSSRMSVRSVGYIAEGVLDFDGRYLGSILFRRDGSSLFGPENRWHNYYRLAGAWRVSEESWFAAPRVDELKVRIAQGTAGGRPPIGSRFETWNVSTGGAAKQQLANLYLRPEHTVEREIALELIVGGRLGIELLHARQHTTEQLFDAPTTAITGFQRQWINSGEMKGQATELTIEARLLDTRRLGWTSTLVADHVTSRISSWDQICLPDNISFTCQGASLRDIYGFRFLRGGRDSLPAWLQPYAGEFDVNDEGYWVWVGEGNTWRDGIARNLWGTSRTIEGLAYQWGHPIVMRNESNTAIRERLGQGDPDLNIGWINAFRVGGFTISGHMHAALGQQMLNDTRKNLTVSGVGGAGRNSMQMVQTGKPDETKKPVQYYTVGLLQGGLPMEEWLEDSSYLKLRSLLVSYTFGRRQLESIGASRALPEGITVSLQGRNLLTLSRYQGFDPEAGNLQGNRVAPLNWYAYPPTRILTAAVEVTF
jgi:TonB-linked SusC/RagA family outer membrane protein